MSNDGLRGRLLVAEPAMKDPNFAETVVLILEHGDLGATGVVLNRPSAVPVGEIVTEWGPFVTPPHQVFVGGPVSPEVAIVLGRAEVGLDNGQGWRSLFGGIGALDITVDPDDAPPGISDVRIFAGYSGWSAGQLEHELGLGGWYVLDRDETDVFTIAPDRLWRTVLTRQQGRLRSVAHFPNDPTVN